MPTQHSENEGLLYLKVEQAIRRKIESGEWSMGQRIPIETKLAEDFGVSRTTIRQAVDALVEAGLVKRRQGSGTYVVKSPYSRSRFAAQPSPTVCRYIYTPFLRLDLQHSYHNMLRIMTAHILMLHKQSLIPEEDASQLIRFIMPLHKQRAQSIGTNPLNEDCFLNFEQYLISNLGLDLGSRMLVARSRNDMHPAMIRMSARDALISVCQGLPALIARLLELARDNRGYVITGYTHLQPSQPITVEFYFQGVAEALLRDYERLLDAYPRVNLSPLGACALAGTSCSTDRDYTAALLGFDGLIFNTLDAVASRDFLLELAACFSQTGITISRYTEDLYLWSTMEFGYVHFSDAVSCCSSIMPQKKNPLSAEHIKSRCAHLASAYTDIAMTLKGTIFSHSRDLFECVPAFWNAAEQMRSILDLSLDMLSGIAFDYERMEKLANRNYSTVTDISEYLERSEHFPYRMAHSIIANALEECNKSGKDTLTLADLKRVGEKLYAREPVLPEEMFADLTDAKASAERKTSAGAPSLHECEKASAKLDAALSAANTRLRNFRMKLADAAALRKDEVKKLLSR